MFQRSETREIDCRLRMMLSLTIGSFRRNRGAIRHEEFLHSISNSLPCHSLPIPFSRRAAKDARISGEWHDDEEFGAAVGAHERGEIEMRARARARRGEERRNGDMSVVC